MQCPHCGAKIKKNEQFCPVCGKDPGAPAALGDAVVPGVAYAPVKKKSKAPIIIGAVAALALAAFLLLDPFKVLPWNSTVEDVNESQLAADLANDEAEDQEELVETESPTDESMDVEPIDEPQPSSQASSVSQSANAGSFSYLLGDWTGELTSSQSIECYGDDSQPFQITFNSINEKSGRIDADLKVLAHAHEKAENAAASDPADTLVEIPGVVLSMSQGNAYSGARLTHETEVNGKRIEFTINLEWPNNENPDQEVRAIVYQDVYQESSRIANYERRFTLVKN